jgi:hypothetical protein
MALGDVLFKIQSAIAKVEKDGNNAHTKSGYPTLEGVLDVINPQLQEHNVLLKQYPIYAEGQWVLRTSVNHAGDSETFDLPLLGIEESRNKMQALGSAITYARRYVLLAYFKLAPTDDDGEGVKVVQEKKPLAQATKLPPKNHAPAAKDMKIPDGKFKGKMASSVPKEEMKSYVEEVLQVMETSGRTPPKWFEELRKVSGL